MVKGNQTVSQHIRGNKGNTLTVQLHSKDLEHVMVVPIEIGKSFHKALVANYFGGVIKDPFEFHNSQEGFRFLHNTITDISKDQPVKEVLIGMEATGHYFKNPASSLAEMGYNNLFILNPLSTSHCRKAGLTWSKTDDTDLRAVGQALISGYGTIYRPEKPLWEDLRQICRYRRFLVRHQTAYKNRIHCILDTALPGITEVKLFTGSHLWSDASLAFFTKYQDIDSIKQLKAKSVIAFFKKKGRRVSPEEAHQLIRWAQEALHPSSSITATRQYMLSSLIERLKQISLAIREMEIKLLGYLVRIPAVVLLSIDYIGPIRAAEFAGEITPIDQYTHSRALIKAAGLDPTRYQSSTQESSKHYISNMGSRALRYIVINTANDLMKHNEYFALFAKELMRRGKSKGCACVAVGNRFIRVAFWMIKDQKSFAPPNGLGISGDPFFKIKAFLQDHQAPELIDEYLSYAKKYLEKRNTLM